MDLLLKWRLRAMSKRLAPRREFVMALERQIREKSGNQKVSPIWRWATVGMTTGMVAFAATGAYAYTSDDVLPDHPLYGIRQAVERVEEIAAVTPEQKAAVRLKLLMRRAHEDEIVLSRRQVIPAERVDAFIEKVEKQIEENERLPEPVKKQLDQRIDQIQEKRIETIEAFASSTTSTEVGTRLREALRKQKERLEDFRRSRIQKLELRRSRLQQASERETRD